MIKGPKFIDVFDFNASGFKEGLLPDSVNGRIAAAIRNHDTMG